MAAVGTMMYPPRATFHSYPQQQSMRQSRALQMQGNIAPALQANPYLMQANISTERQMQASNSIPSEDDHKPSLPSIQNLLGIADGERTQEEQLSSQNQAQGQTQSQHQFQPHSQQQPQRYPSQNQEVQQSHFAQTAHLNLHPDQNSKNSQSQQALAITSPLRNDSVVECTNSPSAISSNSALPFQSNYLGSAMNNVEATEQRVSTAQFNKRHSIHSQPNTSPFANSYSTSPFANSPSANSNGSLYTTPADMNYPISGLYNQRPLPSNFPPQPHIPVQGTPAQAANVWEHHHYISPSSQASFPQSQDRYICPTCSKAFSRPSSLKIHSHSHTGEKPYKCQHAGCGKAFSVRSNMKRHERGCHSGNIGVMSSSLSD